MKKKLLSLTLLAVAILSTGCASMHEKYKNSGWWTPESFNYTLQRDRETGDMSDYFGASWSLK